MKRNNINDTILKEKQKLRQRKIEGKIITFGDGKKIKEKKKNTRH